jgi:hypothetical protein
MQRRDALIALALAAAGQVEVWAFWVPDEQGPKLLAAAFMLALAAPLAWRTRRPFAVAVAVSAIMAAWVLVSVPSGSLVPLVIVMVAAFDVAARTPLRSALIGGACALASVWLIFATTDNDSGTARDRGAQRPRARGARAGRPRPVELGDRRAARGERRDGQDACRQRAAQARPAKSRAGRDLPLRVGAAASGCA